MPINDHLIAFNAAKNQATHLGLDEFTFRGKTYERGMWSNGVPVWRSEAYRGSKKKRKRKSKRSKKSKRSRRR